MESVQLSMIGDTFSKKKNVKQNIANFHFVGAEGDEEMKICGGSHYRQIIIQNLVRSSEIKAYFGYIIGLLIVFS